MDPREPYGNASELARCWAMSEGMAGCCTWQTEAASSVQRPGELCNILHHPAQVQQVTRLKCQQSWDRETTFTGLFGLFNFNSYTLESEHLKLFHHRPDIHKTANLQHMINIKATI